MTAVFWPGGFCLSIFSTGISRFWQFSLILLEEPLVNQILCCSTELQDMLPVCTTLSKITSHRSSVCPGWVRKLKLVLRKLGARKFLTVQFRSIWIWDGAGTTSPSMTPK